MVVLTGSTRSAFWPVTPSMCTSDRLICSMPIACSSLATVI